MSLAARVSEYVSFALAKKYIKCKGKATVMNVLHFTACLVWTCMYSHCVCLCVV